MKACFSHNVDCVDSNEIKSAVVKNWLVVPVVLQCMDITEESATSWLLLPTTLTSTFMLISGLRLLSSAYFLKVARRISL